MRCGPLGPLWSGCGAKISSSSFISLRDWARLCFIRGLINALESAGVAKAQVLDIISNGQYSPDWYNVVPKSTVDTMLTAFNTPAVGASGAIYGVLVAFAFVYSEAKLMLIFLPVPIKAKYFVPLLIAGDLIFGISNVNTGVAHFAHIGGALIGFIMMWYWKKNQFNNKRWD